MNPGPLNGPGRDGPFSPPRPDRPWTFGILATLPSLGGVGITAKRCPIPNRSVDCSVRQQHRVDGHDHAVVGVVVTGDYNADNGVVVAVDTVLLPN